MPDGIYKQHSKAKYSVQRFSFYLLIDKKIVKEELLLSIIKTIYLQLVRQIQVYHQSIDTSGI